MTSDYDQRVINSLTIQKDSKRRGFHAAACPYVTLNTLTLVYLESLCMASLYCFYRFRYAWETSYPITKRVL